MENFDQRAVASATWNGSPVCCHIGGFGWRKAGAASISADAPGAHLFDPWGHPITYADLVGEPADPEDTQRQGTGTRSLNPKAPRVRAEGVWVFEVK